MYTNDEFIGRVAVGVERIADYFSLFPGLQLRFDSTGITGTMEKASYDNLIVVDYEIDCVREAPEQATSEFVVNFLVNEGVSGNIPDTGIKHSKKLFAKSWRFRFIP